MIASFVIFGGGSASTSVYLSSVGIPDFRKGERREGRLDGTRTRFGLGRGRRLTLSAKAWPVFL